MLIESKSSPWSRRSPSWASVSESILTSEAGIDIGLDKLIHYVFRAHVMSTCSTHLGIWVGLSSDTYRPSADALLYHNRGGYIHAESFLQPFWRSTSRTDSQPIQGNQSGFGFWVKGSYSLTELQCRAKGFILKEEVFWVFTQHGFKVTPTIFTLHTNRQIEREKDCVQKRAFYIKAASQMDRRTLVVN